MNPLESLNPFSNETKTGEVSGGFKFKRPRAKNVLYGGKKKSRRSSSKKSARKSRKSNRKKSRSRRRRR